MMSRPSSCPKCGHFHRPGNPCLKSPDEESYWVRVHINREDQTIEFRETSYGRELATSVFRLKEKAFREALVDLGWKPPKKGGNEP